MVEKKLLDIKNDQCILVEFTNEQGKIQTGYLCWVPKKYISDIDQIINEKKEIIVNWPNTDTAEANVMKNKLKNASFEKHPAKILARGEWTEMRQKQSNYINFGTTVTTLKNRRTYKRKSTETDEEQSPRTSKQKKSRQKSVDPSSVNLVQSISLMKELQANIQYDSAHNEVTSNAQPTKDFKKIQESSDPCSVKFDKSLSTIKKSEDIESQVTVSEEDYSSDSETDSETKIDRQKVKISNNSVSNEKREENVNMKGEVTETIENEQPIKDLNEELIELQLKFDTLKEENDKLNEKITNVADLQEKLNKALEENNNLKSMLFSSFKDWNESYQVSKRNVNILQEMFENSNSLQDNSFKEKFYKEKQVEMLQVKPKSTNALKISTKSNKIISDKHEENDYEEQKDILSEPADHKDGDKKTKSSFIITEQMKKKCRQDSITNYTCDLLSKVFTLKELGTCSLKGKQCNANIAKGISTTKPALDETHLQAIKVCLLKKFGRTRDHRALVNAACRSKLCESAKIYKEEQKFENEENPED